MPQSGNWKRFDLSSIIPADLVAGEKYSIRVFEDDYSRNITYLAGNQRYTAFPGGGDEPCNFVDIAAIHLIRL